MTQYYSMKKTFLILFVVTALIGCGKESPDLRDKIIGTYNCGITEKQTEMAFGKGLLVISKSKTKDRIHLILTGLNNSGLWENPIDMECTYSVDKENKYHLNIVPGQFLKFNVEDEDEICYIDLLKRDDSKNDGLILLDDYSIVFSYKFRGRELIDESNQEYCNPNFIFEYNGEKM